MNGLRNPGILIVAIGNISRGDDGIGWAFGFRVEEMHLPCVEVTYRYQLQVEDAELITHYNQVLFVDATRENIKGGFTMKPCMPEPGNGFTSHKQSPDAIMFLALRLFDNETQPLLLAVSGYDWKLGTGISGRGRTNLAKSLNAFMNYYHQMPFHSSPEAAIAKKKEPALNSDHLVRTTGTGKGFGFGLKCKSH